MRVGIIVIDRKYGVNLEQDEHTYTYYTDCLNREVIHMKKTPMYMRFLNKFVLLFEETKDMETEHQIERILGDLDSRAPFAGFLYAAHAFSVLHTGSLRILARAIRRRKISSPKRIFYPIRPTRR